MKLVTIILMITSICSANGKTSKAQSDSVVDTLVDSRDGKAYRIIVLEKQKWMAENLNFEGGNSWCYDGSELKCSTFGRLYDWNTAKTSCPAGWHLPSDDEWAKLESLVGDTLGGNIGKMLKSKSWDGTDKIGFSALPAGFKLWSGPFLNSEKGALFWSSTQNDSKTAWYRFLASNVAIRFRANDKKENGLSVRCVADSARTK